MQKSYNQRYGTDTFGIQKNENSFPLTRLRLTSCTVTILFFERHTIQKYEHDAFSGNTI